MPWQCQLHPLPGEGLELSTGHLWTHHCAKVLLLLNTRLSLFSREAAQPCVITAALMFALITGFPNSRWEISQEGGDQRKRVVKSRNKTMLKKKTAKPKLNPKGQKVH